MKLTLAPGLSIQKSPIDGKGCFATRFFPKGKKIAEYAGERISRREVARRVRVRRKHRICAIDLYWSLDGARGGNGTHYINHCCQPNSYMRTTHGHLLFIALRDIHPGEEITCDYISTHHPDNYRCRCKAPDCRGTINKPVKS
ncbi:MAG TPA: SET domain-containing protein-lysine N-methyltransferase [Pyrinomonadaceae bacterium]|nr:SET domain-containing protein-lysine N-methyltransferase [Pyrinomonadaceae bacterium]